MKGMRKTGSNHHTGKAVSGKGTFRDKAEQRSWNMSRIKSSNTGIEIKVRRYLFSHGYRYRIKTQLPGKPDIVFPGKKVAVFVNGCFWHLHGCKLSSIPKTNTEFWQKKLTANRDRDKLMEERLKSEGFKVIKLWQCELNRDFDSAMSYLIRELTDSQKPSVKVILPK